ncbi:hypothetical protein Tco_1546814 [Tanacetum coccineum]
MGTRDKFDPLIKPHCKPTPFQVLLLQSFPFSTPESQQQQSSSSSEEEEQPTGITMVSLSDDYQTPPQEQPHSVSQNSTQNVVDLNNDTEEIPDELDAHHVLDEMPEKDTHQVFDEMPEREQNDVAVLDRGKRKLPVSLLDNKVTENNSTEGECYKHDVFKVTINRVLKMLVAEGTGKGDDGKGVDFFETAKKKGMTFPRPRWRSAETWKGL